MNSKSFRAEKTAVVFSYVFFVAAAAAVYVSMVKGSKGFVLDDVIFPCAIFACFTTVQAVVFHKSRELTKAYLRLKIICLSKAAAVFLFECYWDSMNINFIREDTVVRSVCVIVFLFSVIAVAAAELLALRSMKRKADKAAGAAGPSLTSERAGGEEIFKRKYKKEKLWVIISYAAFTAAIASQTVYASKTYYNLLNRNILAFGIFFFMTLIQITAFDNGKRLSERLPAVPALATLKFTALFLMSAAAFPPLSFRQGNMAVSVLSLILVCTVAAIFAAEIAAFFVMADKELKRTGQAGKEPASDKEKI